MDHRFLPETNWSYSGLVSNSSSSASLNDCNKFLAPEVDPSGENVSVLTSDAVNVYLNHKKKVINKWYFVKETGWDDWESYHYQLDTKLKM